MAPFEAKVKDPVGERTDDKTGIGTLIKNIFFSF
jgi:hypothetical protein